MRDVMTKIEDEAKDLSLRAAGSEVRGGAAGRHVLSGDMPTMDEAVRLWVEQHPDDAMEAEAARRMDQLGDGGAEDEALEELLRLQEGGSVLASYVFAAMQLDREHPEARDAGLALMTYAADRGFPPACWHMAADCLAETGEDAFNRSWEWLGRGAMAGSCECCVEMGSLFLNSAVHLPEESCRMLAEQLLDFARSGSWKPLETLLNLGLAKVPGTMPAEALDEALALLLEYAEGGHVPAMTLAGVMHAEGRLLERDRHEAARWLKGAWQAGSAEGGCQLARLWLNDPAADRAETEEAREILEICCLDDNALAHALMARTAMESGRDVRVGYSMLRRAAELGLREKYLDFAVFSTLGARGPEQKERGERMFYDPVLDDAPETLERMALLRMTGLDGRSAMPDQGFEMLKLAVAGGWNKSVGTLAGICLMGLYGMPENHDQGSRWAMEGLRRHDPRSVVLLALSRLRFFPGDVIRGNTVSAAQAASWLAWADALGDPLARAWQGFRLATGRNAEGRLSEGSAVSEAGRDEGARLMSDALRHALARLEPAVPAWMAYVCGELEKEEGGEAVASAIAGHCGIRDARTAAELAAFCRDAAEDPTSVWRRLRKGLPVFRSYPLN